MEDSAEVVPLSPSHVRQARESEGFGTSSGALGFHEVAPLRYTSAFRSLGREECYPMMPDCFISETVLEELDKRIKSDEVPPVGLLLREVALSYG